MIGKLKGIIDTIAEDHVILDVNGVGYIIFASAKTLSQLPGIGGQAGLMIETHVREDHIHLYGFASPLEKEWFKVLTSVQGVGVRMGLAILSVFGPDQLVIAITAKDSKALTAVSGVGPKLADRIVTELKNKVDKIAISSQVTAMSEAIEVSAPAPKTASKTSKKAKETSAAPSLDMSQLEDAISALTNLGYGRTEAHSSVIHVMQENEGASLDALIAASLKRLASQPA